MLRNVTVLAAVTLAACTTAPRTGGELAGPGLAVQPPTSDYLTLVVSESSDDVALVRFGPAGARVERSFKTGMMPTEINGPHGVSVSPDGESYYVTVAHGAPVGTLWKYSTANDSLLGRVTLGLFPASLQASPDGIFVFVVNFNLHGDMVPSSVSVVDAERMVEVVRIPTCTMPHGSRFDPSGARHYSTCMMDDLLVEIDTRTFDVARHFRLSRGHEAGFTGRPPAAPGDQEGLTRRLPTAPGREEDSTVGPRPAHHADASCSPTWAQPSADGAMVYVACNRSNEIVEVDAAAWVVRRRLPAGEGVYNLATTPDGKLLVATNKRGRSVSVFSLPDGREVARIPTQRAVVHGVAIASDGRYAFVTVEGSGAEPGTLEVIDLVALRRVASVDLGQQAAGVDFWKVQAPAR